MKYSKSTYIYICWEQSREQSTTTSRSSPLSASLSLSKRNLSPWKKSTPERESSSARARNSRKESATEVWTHTRTLITQAASAKINRLIARKESQSAIRPRVRALVTISTSKSVIDRQQRRRGNSHREGERERQARVHGRPEGRRSQLGRCPSPWKCSVCRCARIVGVCIGACTYMWRTRSCFMYYARDRASDSFAYTYIRGGYIYTSRARHRYTLAAYGKEHYILEADKSRLLACVYRCMYMARERLRVLVYIYVYIERSRRGITS